MCALARRFRPFWVSAALVFAAGLAWTTTPAHAAGAQATGAVRGRVVDAETGAPLPGVLVAIREPAAEAVTDAEGRFSLVGLPPGTHTLYVSLVGYVLARPTVDVAASATTSGPSEELVVPLTAGAGAYTEAVTVRGEAAPPRSAAPLEFRVRSADLQDLRGVLADDTYRALQALPGVATGDDFRAEFSVRGGEFRQIGVAVDGIAAPWLVHGPRDVGDTGTVAMLNADVVESITLTTGAAPQPFSNRTSAWVTSAIREGSRDAFRVNGLLSGTGASVVLEGPLGRGRRGSWLATGRQSYIDWLLRQIDFADNATFGFSDAQVKLVYDVSPRHQVQLTGVTGRSLYEERDETPSANGLKDGGAATGFLLGTWRATLGDRVVVTERLAAARQTYRNRGDFAQELGRGHGDALTARTDVAVQVGARAALDATVEVVREHASAERRAYTGAGPTTPVLRSVQRLSWHRTRTGGHVRARLTPWASMQVDGGARVDRESREAQVTASPWMVARWALSPRWALGAGASLTHQLAELEQLPIGVVSPPSPERARSLDLSTEIRPVASWTLQLGVYDREERGTLRFDQPWPRLVGTTIRVPPATSAWQNALDITARGVETLVRRTAATGPTGWVAYAFGKTRARDRATGERYWSDLDQRHLLNVFLAQRLGTRTQVSAKFRYGSNTPIPGYFAGRAGALTLAARRNDVRLPAYARLDLRLNRTFHFTRRRLTLFAEVINVLGRDNIGLADGAIRGGGNVNGFTEPMLPRLPSAGFRLEF